MKCIIPTYLKTYLGVYGLIGWVLIVYFQACIPTSHPTQVTNPIFCEIDAEWNENNKKIKSQVKFYTKDSTLVRPYFLNNPLKWNEKEMKKKYSPLKGVYYIFNKKGVKKDTHTLSFTNVNQQQHQITFNFPQLSDKKWNKTVSLDEILQVNLSPYTEIILVDAKQAMWQVNARLEKKKVAKGKAIILEVSTQDSTYQIQDNLWCTYSLKTLSKGQEVIIE